MEKHIIIDEFHTYKVNCFSTNNITSQKKFKLFQKMLNKQIKLNNLTKQSKNSPSKLE